PAAIGTTSAPAIIRTIAGHVALWILNFGLKRRRAAPSSARPPRAMNPESRIQNLLNSLLLRQRPVVLLHELAIPRREPLAQRLQDLLPFGRRQLTPHFARLRLGRSVQVRVCVGSGVGRFGFLRGLLRCHGRFLPTRLTTAPA